MLSRKVAVWVIITGFLSGAAVADATFVQKAWVRATPPGSTVAAAYLTIDNTGRPADRLLSVSSPAAATVEVHATIHDGELVRMRKVEPLHIAAGERVSLEPGGTHVMLMSLKAPLRQGDKLPLMLRFENAGEVRLEADILAGDATDPHAHHQH